MMTAFCNGAYNSIAHTPGGQLAIGDHGQAPSNIPARPVIEGYEGHIVVGGRQVIVGPVTVGESPVIVANVAIEAISQTTRTPLPGGELAQQAVCLKSGSHGFSFGKIFSAIGDAIFGSEKTKSHKHNPKHGRYTAPSQAESAPTPAFAEERGLCDTAKSIENLVKARAGNNLVEGAEACYELAQDTVKFAQTVFDAEVKANTNAVAGGYSDKSGLRFQ